MTSSSTSTCAPSAAEAAARRYRTVSLRTKFAVHIAVSITILFGILIPAVVYLQTRAALEQAKHRGLQLAKVFAHSSVQAVVADDFLVMRHIVNSIASEPDVLYAMILDPSGRVLVHNDMREMGATYRDALTAAAIRADRPSLEALDRPDGASFDFAVPIYVLNERRAVARVGISFEREMAGIRWTRNMILAVGALSLLAGLALARWQARSVTRPVGALVQGVDEITRGNLDHRIPSETADELGQLAQAFNRMTASIQALIETSRDISSALDLDGVLRSIATHVQALVKADLVFLAPFDKTTQEARVRVVLGARTAALDHLPFTPGRGIGGLVLASGEPFRTVNYLADPRIVHDPAYDASAQAEGIVAELAVPITLKTDIVGVLWAANRTATSFTDEDVDSIQRMAGQAAIAMENARLYADTRLKTARLEALIQVSRMMTSTLDPHQIADVITKAMSDLMDGIVVRMWETPADAVEWRPLGHRDDAFSMPAGQGLVGAVAGRRSWLVVDDIRDDARVIRPDLIARQGLVSFLGLPLSREDKLLGVLCIFTRAPHRFTPDEIALFGSLAQQAAIALENARLYQDLRASHQELLSTQEQLVRKARMAAMGEIAAAVAHEARNPLGALSNCVQLLRGNPDIAGEDAELLAIIQAESKRLNEIISDFLAFGRPRAPRFENVELHDLIDETWALLQRDDRCPAAMTFVRDFDPSAPKVWADRDQLRQVFWNLFLNAVQAMPDGGELRVESHHRGPAVEIAVRDTGPGIPAAAVARIFEPFYTTKSGGTGLGLAIVRRIIEDHGGGIAVDTDQEAGTCFRLSLALDPKGD